jgi:hypothetical protein
MAWEVRGGRHYYYRSRRIDGRVCKEYVGTGPVADIVAQWDEQDRRGREEETEALREERRHVEGLEEPIRELCDAAETLARAALVASGYRQHNRGEWRKRHERPS